jgi:hypothetical protein
MGRVAKLEASKVMHLNEAWELEKPAKYDLSTTLSQSSEGLSP